jgi:hypothetical protein
VLLDRLPFDEVDLLAGPPPEPGEQARIRARRVTLRDLGVDADPAAVAAALVQGFEEALDISFASTVTSGSARRQGASLQPQESLDLR